MNKVKQCLIVVGDTLDPTPMYENGYKFLSRCGMHFVSLSKVLYSIYCDNVFKKNPTHDDVASLTQCNQSLVPDGEYNVSNTNKVITKYAINEGSKDFIEFIAKNFRNFQVENITSGNAHPSYGHEFCKVLNDYCNSPLVREYTSKTLSMLNNQDHSDTTQEDSWCYAPYPYLVIGATIFVATGYALSYYRLCKSVQEQEDVFFYQSNLDNLQAQSPQTRGTMESTAPQYIKIEVHEAEISDQHLFYPPIYSGATSEARGGYEFVDGGAIGNSAPDGDIRNCARGYQTWDVAFSDQNSAMYNSIPSGFYSYCKITAEPVDNSVAYKDVINTTCTSNSRIPEGGNSGKNLATDNCFNMPKCINNMQPNPIYREVYDTERITNHEENSYMLPVDEN